MTVDEVTVVPVAEEEEELVASSSKVVTVVEKDKEETKEMGKEHFSIGANGGTVKEDTDGDNDYVLVDGSDGVNGDQVGSDLEKNGNGNGGEDPGVANLEINGQLKSESQEPRSCVEIVDHEKEPVELCHVECPVVEQKPGDLVDSGPVSAINVEGDVSETSMPDQNGVSEPPEAVSGSNGNASANKIAKQTVSEAAADSGTKQSDEVSSVPVSDSNEVSLANDSVEDSGLEDSRSKEREDSEIAVVEDGDCNGDRLTNNSAKNTISGIDFGSGHEQNGVSKLPVSDDGVPPDTDDAGAKDAVSEAAVISGTEQDDGIRVSVSFGNVDGLPSNVEDSDQSADDEKSASSNIAEADCNGPVTVNGLSAVQLDVLSENGPVKYEENVIAATVQPDVLSENQSVKRQENVIAPMEDELETNSEGGFSSRANTGLEEKEKEGSISNECGDDHDSISETIENEQVKDENVIAARGVVSVADGLETNSEGGFSSKANTGLEKETGGEALQDDSISETVENGPLKHEENEIARGEVAVEEEENEKARGEVPELPVENGLEPNSEDGFSSKANTGLQKETGSGSISDELGEAKDSQDQSSETDPSLTNVNVETVESAEKADELIESIEPKDADNADNHVKVPLTPIQFGSVVDEDKISKELEAVVDEVEVDTEKKKLFSFLIKVPRYDDEDLKEKIRLAQIRVDEKTQSRDAIRIEMHRMRAICKEYGDNFDAAISQEKVARDLLKSKCQEIESIQSAINIEDIGSRIRNMEHMIQHETLPLKEEKQLIREIKQLKQVREQLSSNMRDGVQQDEKEQTEQRLKSLKKEADQLRDNLQKAAAVTKAAKKKYYDETEKMNKLLSQFKAADDIRQEAYAQLQSLKKQSYEKNKCFWQYRDDVKAANELALKGDKEALQSLCYNQVERIMDFWNNNDEFRNEYMRFNMRSTLRRLKTLDGRALGPNEEPPTLPERVVKHHSISISTLEERTQEIVALPKAEKANGKPVAKDQTIKFEKPKSVPPARDLTTASTAASTRDEMEEERKENAKRTEEEEELARRAEELRKEEEAAKLREQRRLEEIVKAKEALERKKRIAEKAQARAVFRAQKEAEQKEKEREKRAKKKERRKAPTGDASVSDELEHPPETQIETAKEEKPVMVAKKNQKSSQFIKQTKIKSIPPPFRNRGKRRMQPWMWVVIVVVIFALFLVGNSYFFQLSF